MGSEPQITLIHHIPAIISFASPATSTGRLAICRVFHLKNGFPFMIVLIKGSFIIIVTELRSVDFSMIPVKENLPFKEVRRSGRLASKAIGVPALKPKENTLPQGSDDEIRAACWRGVAGGQFLGANTEFMFAWSVGYIM